MAKFAITFLSTYEGTGYMELDDTDMTLMKITDEQGVEISNCLPYSYKVTDND
jgi:hypothetical protein